MSMGRNVHVRCPQGDISCIIITIIITIMWVAGRPRAAGHRRVHREAIGQAREAAHGQTHSAGLVQETDARLVVGQ